MKSIDVPFPPAFLCKAFCFSQTGPVMLPQEYLAWIVPLWHPRILCGTIHYREHGAISEKNLSTLIQRIISSDHFFGLVFNEIGDQKVDCLSNSGQ